MKQQPVHKLPFKVVQQMWLVSLSEGEDDSENVIWNVTSLFGNHMSIGLSIKFNYYSWIEIV